MSEGQSCTFTSMEEKQNCIQTPVNKGTAQFCYKKQKMESYIPFTTCRKRQIQQKKRQHFKIVTDCSAFQKTMQKKELITRIARWALQLEEFDYEIEHRAGSRMKNVDALSRYPVMTVCNDTLTSKLKKTQEEDDNIQTLKSLLEKQESEEFFERNGILYKYINGRELIVTPKAMQAELIKLIHENGHFSVGKTEEIVKQEFFIPNLSNVVKKVIVNCVPCILANKKTGKKEGFLNPISKESIPLSTYHVDLIGPLPSTNQKYQHIFTVVDAFTKFTWLYPVKTVSAESALEKLKQQQKTFEQREFLRNDAKKNIETLQSENRKTYNRRRRKASLYKEGDLVAIQRTQFGAGLKLRPKFLGPYRVTKVNSKDRYEVEKVGQHEGSNSTTTSADLMKHFYA
ncbi:transposon Ty3-I Gag-Pol polyprotein [Trichonephila clavipes]|nr:transposon Ty3-I Gag-Pol polyprotein [Trichonephila clavipes]